MKRAAYFQGGLTAIELLIYASMLGLVVVFTVPFISDTTKEKQLREALEITEDSVRQARRAARLYKTDVILHIESDGMDEKDAITLTFPNIKRNLVLNAVTNAFTLPDGVDIVSSETQVHFDRNGEVNWPAKVMIVYNSTSDHSEHLVID